MATRKLPPVEVMPPPIRSTDDPVLAARVRREVPLWGVLGGIFTVIAVSVNAWFQLQEQGKTLLRMETAQQAWQSSITAQLQELNGKLNATNLKDIEHDFKLKDLDSRLTRVEAGKK